MGSVDNDRESLKSANRRAEAIDWLDSVLPEFDLALDASDEMLREQLSDGTLLCGLLDRLMPGAVENARGGFSGEQRSTNVKKFLSVIAEMGLPGFSLRDLDEGPMSPVVQCLLNLRDNMGSDLGEDASGDGNAGAGQIRRKWNVPETEGAAAPGKRSKDQSSSVAGEERRKGASDSKSQQRSPVPTGQKFREVFQLKRGSYSDLPAAKISEMMHSNGLDNATTQSLLSVVNGILDESIERKKGEIPHRVVYLLRKIVQEIERRISTQAEHIRNQADVMKTREDKYRSKIKALETLVNGTNEENQIVVNRLELVKAEKSKIEEKIKLGEKDAVRLAKEKEQAEQTISKLKLEMEMINKMHEQQRQQIESKARETEKQLYGRIKEIEVLLEQSKNKIVQVEAASEQKTQLWKKREGTFWSFIEHEQYSVKDIKAASESIKEEVYNCQMRWSGEISNLGIRLKGLVDAAENYHRVLAENQRLFNEVQELKGNIRVYCRVRPFLPGQDGKSTTVDYIGENGELLISNPFKQGKEGHRMFKFNKVFNLLASQADVFSDIQPLIRSVLDGFNVCIFAYGQTGSGKTYTMSGPGTSKEDWGVNYRALNDLFDISLSRRNAFQYEVGVQMVEIYNEQVRDLLSNDIAQKRLGIWSTSQPNGLVVPEASLLPVKATSDVLDLMEIGLANRAVGSTALNERSSRSHSILTVHVRGLDLKNRSTSRGCLHLIDLAGSERVERSEATGDRLKEAQYINKSLSALGDVIFALSQKSNHVPYRNSKLTQVLQSSLGGQAKTLMFVQINPDVESYAETISTLKFAERVSGVELGAARSNKEGKDIKELLEQVSSLKDTVARKDLEIEQLQQLKDLKSKTNGSNLLKLQSSSQGFPSLGSANQQSQFASTERTFKSAQRVSYDPQSFAEVSRKSPELNGADSGHVSPSDMEPAALGETDYEDRVSNASDDSFSMEGETESSIGGAFEVVPFPNSDRNMDTETERMQGGPPRGARAKNGQPATSKPKMRDPLLKNPGLAKAPSTSSQVIGSAAKGSKRWQ